MKALVRVARAALALSTILAILPAGPAAAGACSMPVPHRAAALRWLMRHAEVRFSGGPAGPAPWEKAGEGRGPIIEGEAEVVEPEGRPDPQSPWLVQDEPDKRK